MVEVIFLLLISTAVTRFCVSLLLTGLSPNTLESLTLYYAQVRQMFQTNFFTSYTKKMSSPAV